MKIRNLSLAGLFLIILTSALFSQNKENSVLLPSLENVFANPPVSTRPHVYWYWVSNNISREGIRKDLEAMAKIGIGGVNIAQIGYKDSPIGKVKMFSEEWWDCLTYAMEEATRLGIEVSLFNSPGWSGTGGVWIKPEQAMRYLDVHEYKVKGPQKLVMQLPDYASKERVPQSSLSFQYEIDKSTFKFQQVGIQAFLAPKGSNDLISSRQPVITSNPKIEGVEAMFDGNEATKASLFSLPVSIELSLKESLTIRSLEIVPADIPCNAWCKLEYQNVNGEWEKVLSRRINRGETRIIASGFLPFAPVSQSFSAVSSKKFRITLSENETASPKPIANADSKKEEKARIAEIKLLGTILLNNYAEKQLGNKAAYDKGGQTALLPNESGFAIKTGEVLNLQSYVDKTGLLTWDVPAGDWTIQHSGMNQTGVQIHPVPSDEVRGFSADALNKEAIQASFDAYIGQILKHIPAEKRKTLTRIVLDSYEQGSANWTDGFAQKFRSAYGYDPMPWTPVLKGHIVESPEQSDRFLWDLRRLVADLIPENFSGAISERSHQNGLKFWHEPYAGHGFPGEFLNLGKYDDVPAGEFWVAGSPGADFATCRAGSSVANVYGRKIVSVETFTSNSTYLYKMIPRDLKILGDWAFAQGMNHYTFHVSVLQPNDDKPGINTWYGTEFNRNNNWFQDAKTYVDYIKRISALVQRGQRQTDLAFYIGDDVPCDKPVLPYTLPPGYDLDFINFDALINLAKVENGRLSFPSGASYRVLILPPSTLMRPELLQKLEGYVKEGLIVYGPKPLQSPSLKGFPVCDDMVKNLADRLWGAIDGKNIMHHSYGKGQLFFGQGLAGLLKVINLTPDAEMPADFVFTHRKEADTEIYFIANQKNEPRKVNISFKVINKQPELWDPLTGERRKLNQYSMKEGRTVIPMEFAQAGSCFVLFRNGGKPSEEQLKNYPDYTQTQTISGKWEVNFNSSINPAFTRTLEKLSDWTSSREKEVKYFCGKATYAIGFPFGGKLPGNWYLNLGKVESLAKIKLNGREVNTLWCYPYRANVSDYLVNGENKLEVEMVNQWWNQLIGDEQPGAIRKTKVSARLFWKANDSLVPSGLLGPVTLETIK
ncbi:MAG: glycosyl hydrolase [Prolixibacteraceae bacterium]